VTVERGAYRLRPLKPFSLVWVAGVIEIICAPLLLTGPNASWPYQTLARRSMPPEVVDAPHSCAGKRQIEEGEAVKHFRLATIEQREEAARGAQHEVGDPRHAVPDAASGYAGRWRGETYGLRKRPSR
jgi:hypothetical protein